MIPLSDTKSYSGFPFWVAVIILINTYIFFLELTSIDPDAFITRYALIPAQIDFSSWKNLTPFITSQFLHGGFLHIISNMLFLWVFGDNVEKRMGFVLFPFFYLLCGGIGAFAQFIIMPNSTIPMLGASGAIAGVLGAYLYLFPHHSIRTLVPVFGFPTIIGIPAAVILIYWFVTQLFTGSFSLLTGPADIGGVAYLAHIGGFVFGWVLAHLFPKSEDG